MDAILADMEALRSEIRVTVRGVTTLATATPLLLERLPAHVYKPFRVVQFDRWCNFKQSAYDACTGFIEQIGSKWMPYREHYLSRALFHPHVVRQETEGGNSPSLMDLLAGALPHTCRKGACHGADGDDKGENVCAEAAAVRALIARTDIVTAGKAYLSRAKTFHVCKTCSCDEGATCTCAGLRAKACGLKKTARAFWRGIAADSELFPLRHYALWSLAACPAEAVVERGFSKVRRLYHAQV